ncbi:MAG: 3-hydroxyacyl-CoA dehydrogenase family protein [Tepidanaerobacteraceae bacterium]|nr:3-hydroxyacyl-CoA dehydrogenase family protein [Tepidanaerobacteraceae bacterium]
MKSEQIKKIGIAGAGTMGATFAHVFAESGYTVVLQDIAEEFLERGRKIINVNQNNLVKEGLLTEDVVKESHTRLSYTTDINAFEDVDFILEAIVEKLDIKQEFWAKVSRLVKKSALMASNTSGLSITQIAKDIADKSRFAGMHWWNPPHLIPLVEVIKGEETSDETAQSLIDLARKLNKKPVLVKKDAPGFIGNRLQYALLREALHIVDEGIATAQDVDDAMKYGLGFRYAGLGPIETVDLGGIDVFNNVGSYLFRALNNSPEIPKKLRELYEQGLYGIKTGRGFFDYSGGKGEEALRKRDAHFVRMLKCLYKRSE